MPVTLITNIPRGLTDEAESLERRVGRLDLPAVEVGFFTPGWGMNDTYHQRARTLFDFFRRAGDGRYSSRTLMDFMRASEAEDTRPNREVSPSFYTIATPFEYDERTEVKSGGLLAACASFVYANTNKLLIAVAPGARRSGFGSLLSQWYRDNVNASPVTFVHANNTSGLQFALATDWEPFSVSGNGTVKLIPQGHRSEHRRWEEREEVA